MTEPFCEVHGCDQHSDVYDLCPFCRIAEMEKAVIDMRERCAIPAKKIELRFRGRRDNPRFTALQVADLMAELYGSIRDLPP